MTSDNHNKEKDKEEVIGAIESSLGNITVSPTSSKKNHNNNNNNDNNNNDNNHNDNINHQNKNVPSSYSIEKTDSILMKEQKEEEMKLVSASASNDSIEVDLSNLRGIQPQLPPSQQQQQQTQQPTQQQQQEEESALKNNNSNNNNNNNSNNNNDNDNSQKDGGNIDEENHNSDLEALSELVPGLKTGQVGAKALNTSLENKIIASAAAAAGGSGDNNLNTGNGSNSSGGLGGQMMIMTEVEATAMMSTKQQKSQKEQYPKLPHPDSMIVHQGIDALSDDDEDVKSPKIMDTVQEDEEDDSSDDDDSEESEQGEKSYPTTNDIINSYTSKPTKGQAGPPGDQADSSSDGSKSTDAKTHSSGDDHKNDNNKKKDPTQTTLGSTLPLGKPPTHNNSTDRDKQLQHPYAMKSNINNDNNNNIISTTPMTPDESMYGSTPTRHDYIPQSSAASISTATQTQAQGPNDMRMPMYLPNFRPATGCTNASDFIVRCFAARLRSGITVVKHGRSRWCKSRLRILHVHSDGRSLSWKPAQGEPSSSKRPPKLDLSTCLEVRHAWSPDPLNPMFTGTPILRSKCEASNAFKSFALIFPKRTVDITAVTADQCKVLMEGFSALCFRLQVATMTGRGNRPDGVSMINDGNNETKSPNVGEDEKGTATTGPISGGK